MHGDANFVAQISGFLGFYYLTLALMNGVASLMLWLRFQRATAAVVWLSVSGVFVILAALAFGGQPAPMWGFTESWWSGARDAVDRFFDPISYSVISIAVLWVMYAARRFFVKPMVAWTGLNLALFAMGLSMTDSDFAAIVTKPDNVPIVGLVFLLGFFTWLATAKAVENDDRAAQGLPPREKEDDEKVLVWPDLVYTELICMIALTALLILWGIGLQAPLEEPGSSVKTPNPSKAPWYFLGLQEMLVYYDPWMAGVVLPSLIIVGLMAIPYIDFNKKGNGYYTINERRFSYLMFQFGFLVMWVTLIVLGTFLRGPNWNFFGPYEYWDAHKVLALNNVDLSQYFWNMWLGQPLPKAAGTDPLWKQIGMIIWRELPGIVLLMLYFLALPPLLAATVFRSFFVKMGFIRFMVMANLLLFMASLPLKMVLRWTVNLKYIVAIPEYFLNF